MTVVQIAQDLLVQTYEVPDPSYPGYYSGAECSIPVAMPPRALVKVNVVLQRVVGSDFEALAHVQGSNDLSVWHTVHAEVLFTAGDLLPMTKPIASGGGGIRVPYAHCRVLWTLYPASEPLQLGPDQGLLLSADLSAQTGLDP